jgi:hypothetical protein
MCIRSRLRLISPKRQEVSNEQFVTPVYNIAYTDIVASPLVWYTNIAICGWFSARQTPSPPQTRGKAVS